MATAHSLAGLMKWSRREEWQGPFDEMLERHVGAVCAKMGVMIEELPDLIGDRFSMLWGCVFEDFLARDFDDGRNVVDAYLKRRGWKECASNKAYMMALRSSMMSLYEVSGIVRDESFLARDLVRGGEPVRVSERMGTHYLKPWDRIAARIVKVGATTQMAGGILPFYCEVSESVLMALRRAGKRARKDVGRLARELVQTGDKALIDAVLSDTEILRASAFVFTNFWLGNALRRVLNPTLPRMYNTDGDELVFTTVRYPLNSEATVPAIGTALAEIPALYPESETFWNWVELRKPPRRKRKDSHTFVTTLGDGSTVLGTVELKDRTLVLETNSPQRAERGRALIEPVLGGLVGSPLFESRAPEELMASPPARRSRPLSSGLTPDAEQAVIHAYLDEHYLSLLDEPVAMLGNATPRQAAKTAKGRASSWCGSSIWRTAPLGISLGIRWPVTTLRGCGRRSASRRFAVESRHTGSTPQRKPKRQPPSRRRVSIRTLTASGSSPWPRSRLRRTARRETGSALPPPPAAGHRRRRPPPT